MENLGEYDRITQTVGIPEDVIAQAMATGDELKLRKYILNEAACGIARKLVESGYITETWLKTEHSEECTAILYVKPLINK